MSLPVTTTVKEMKEKKWIKTRIGVGYTVKEKVGETEENIREGRSRRTGKEVSICVQAVLWKNNFLVQVKDGKKRDISAYWIPYIIEKK